MRSALESSDPERMVIKLDAVSWLKIQELRNGGQGEVWVACPCDAAAKSDQLVALKSPNPSKPVATLDKLRGHLQQEIDILRKIRPCKFIANLVDADRPSGTLATRLIDGPSLEEKAQSQRRLSVAQTIQVGIDVCQALKTLHDVGYIHTDVKPANIIDEHGKRAVLIDFGLAEVPTQAALLPGGTPYYIAPEVFTCDSPHDVRADVYSLAATLYRLLAGQPPHFYQCINPGKYKATRAKLDMRWFHLADSALDCDLEDIRREVPRQLCQLLYKALSADREHRPSSILPRLERLTLSSPKPLANGLFSSEFSMRIIRAGVIVDFQIDLESIQSMFVRADDIERQLWGLSEVLLEAFRIVHHDDRYAGKEWDNAAKIRTNIERALPQFTVLSQLSTTVDTWTGIPSAYALIPRTTKLWSHVEAIGRQLREFLADHTDATELLKDLVVRTLESIRLTSIDAVAAATIGIRFSIRSD